MRNQFPKTRVLLSGAGGPAAIGVMKAIDEPDVEFHTGDMDANAVGLYLVPAERRVLLPPAGHPQFVDRVLDYCRRQQINVFWPTVDLELSAVAARRREFEKEGIKLVLPKDETLRACLDPRSPNGASLGVVEAHRESQRDRSASRSSAESRD